MIYVVVAKTRMNFYPGTMTPTPPEYRHVQEKQFPTREGAAAELAAWRNLVKSPGWEFSIEERDESQLPPQGAPNDTRRIPMTQSEPNTERKIDDGGLVFPHPQLSESEYGHVDFHRGMTMRAYFAAKAMQAFLASNFEGCCNNDAKVARWAYSVADQMILAGREQSSE